MNNSIVLHVRAVQRFFRGTKCRFDFFSLFPLNAIFPRYPSSKLKGQVKFRSTKLAALSQEKTRSAAFNGLGKCHVNTDDCQKVFDASVICDLLILLMYVFTNEFSFGDGKARERQSSFCLHFRKKMETNYGVFSSRKVKLKKLLYEICFIFVEFCQHSICLIAFNTLPENWSLNWPCIGFEQ